MSSSILFYTLLYMQLFNCGLRRMILSEFAESPESLGIKSTEEDTVGPKPIIVSTIDGCFNAFDSLTGKKLWGFQVKPFFESNLSELQIISDGKQISLIPGLDGTIYKFDGVKIEKLSMNIESLLDGSYKLGDDIYAMAKRETNIFGINMKTGKVLYICAADGCKEFSTVKSTDSILILTTVTNEVRVIKARSGSTVWHYRVTTASATVESSSSFKLISRSSSSEIEGHISTFENEHINVNMADSQIEVKDSEGGLWSQKLLAPITDVWLVAEDSVKRKDLVSHDFLDGKKMNVKAALFLGVYKDKLYLKILNNATNALIKDNMQIRTYIPVETDSHVIDKNTLTKNGYMKIPGEGIIFYDPLDYGEENSTSCTIINKYDYCIFKVRHTVLFGFYIVFITLVTAVFLFTFYNKTFQHLCCQMWFKIINFQSQSTFEVESKTYVVENVAPVNVEISSTVENSFSSRFLQDFEPKSCLGVGGFGIVFECVNKMDDSSYAIKRTALKRGPPLVDRLKREVTALAKLNHPHIVRYYTAWIEEPPLGWQEDKDEFWIKNLSGFSPESNVWSTDEDSCVYVYPFDSNRSILKTYLYIQMELCRKESLNDWLLVSRGDRNKTEVFVYFLEIVSAVQYIHESGLIHRDLKPSNIFFSMSGEIKVGDFGLVSQIKGTSITERDTSDSLPYPEDAGTLLYMSPEQIKNQDYNHKVDIYSLGIILYEMLIPFSTFHEKIKAISNARNLDFDKEFIQENPHELSLLLKLLSTNPDERPSIETINYSIYDLLPGKKTYYRINYQSHTCSQEL